MRLDHIALTVLDRERSAAFYAEHFGMRTRVHEDDERLILSDDAGGLLALCEGTPGTPLPPQSHFGFSADGDEVRAARERFSRAGVTETEWQESHGFVRCQVLDPDGYRVEVYGDLDDRTPPATP